MLLSVLGAVHCPASEAGDVNLSAGQLHPFLRRILVLVTFCLCSDWFLGNSDVCFGVGFMH